MEFINNVIAAKYDFGTIRDAIVNLYKNITAEGVGVKELWDIAWGFLGGIIGNFTGIILIALSLILAFFGKKLMGFIKVVGFAVVGFGCGMYFLAPLVKNFAGFIPDWVVGLLVALIAALLYKVLYWVLIGGGVGYLSYAAMYRGTIVAATKENWMIALGVAVVAVVVLFLLLKPIEAIGTAALGGYLAALSIKSVFDYTTLLPIDGQIVVYIVGGIIAVLGLIVQYATRSRRRF